MQSGDFVPAFHGGYVQGASGRAGFVSPRSANLRIAATLRLAAIW